MVYHEKGFHSCLQDEITCSFRSTENFMVPPWWPGEGWGLRRRGGLWAFAEGKKANRSPQLLGMLRGTADWGVMRTLRNLGSKRCNLFIFVFGFIEAKYFTLCSLPFQWSSPEPSDTLAWLTTWLWSIHIPHSASSKISLSFYIRAGVGLGPPSQLVSLRLSLHTVWWWREPCSYSDLQSGHSFQIPLGWPLPSFHTDHLS